MKFSWGYGLMIVFTLFATLMFSLVYKSMKTSVNLVSEKYYEDELKYQETLNKAANASALSSAPVLHQKKDSLNIYMPHKSDDQIITGTVRFCLLSDATHDKMFQLSVNDWGYQTVSTRTWRPGYYQVKLNWISSGIEYYAEQKLLLH